ncbi:hypothetical protein ABZ173_09990 [Streptomyces rochei]|uniref:hypothetical protein n=1 Tax=Streptomyces rochei TaxID=1928 RepID=UPI0033BF5901
MSAPSTIAAALASLLDTAPSWLPQVDHWEIAEDTDTWVLSGQLAGDLREAEAFRLLAPMMERAKTAHSDDGRLVKVPFEWDGVPGQVWYLRPVERYVVPERCATCPTLLAGAGNQFVRLGGRGAPVICVPCRDRMHETWVREAAVRELGALPMPAGPEPQQPRTVLDRARAVLGARLSKDDLRLTLGSVIDYATELKRQRNVFRDQRNNVVATNEQLLAKVEESGQARLRAENDARTLTRQVAELEKANEGLDDLRAKFEAQMSRAETLDRLLREAQARVAELEAAPAFLYRAEHPDSGVVLGTYSNREAAVAHCEAIARREGATGLVSWVPDDGDALSPEELTFFDVEYCDGDDVPVQTCTGYVVTPLKVAAEYDAEADE